MQWLIIIEVVDVFQKNTDKIEEGANWREKYKFPETVEESMEFYGYIKKIMIRKEETNKCEDGCYLLLTLRSSIESERYFDFREHPFNIMIHTSTPDSQKGYGLVFLDYIAISMILRIRKQLLESDQNECFMTLFKYPTIENISELVRFSNSLQIAIEELLHGKRSAFLDQVLGIKSTDNKGNDNKNTMNMGSMAFMPQSYGFPNNNFNNDNESKENKGFFKNAMNSMGGFFSNMKQKIEQKMEKKPSNNINNNNNGGEILNPIGNNGVEEIKSLKDSAQRIDAIFEKYKQYMAGPDINEYKAIIQYLYNYK